MTGKSKSKTVIVTVERSIQRVTYPTGSVRYKVDKRFGEQSSKGRHIKFFDTLKEARAYKKESIDKQHENREWKSFVYFIKNLDTGHIKIGKAASPEKRFCTVRATMRTHRVLYGQSEPNLKLLGWIKQSGSINEDKLHHHFSEYRVSGEWFSPNIEAEVKKILKNNESFKS